MCFQKLFEEADALVIDYEGKQVYRCLQFKKQGKYTITIRAAASHSGYTQAVILHIGNLDGRVRIEDQCHQKKGAFSQVVLSETELTGEITIEIEMNSGSFSLCNGSDPLGTGKLWNSLTQGAALTGTKLEDGWYRIFCNDFEYDDDFDDFIFDMKIERNQAPIEILEECEAHI